MLPSGRFAILRPGTRLRCSSTIMTDSTVSATAACYPRSCFTGKERDTESGNDYFGARYYSSSMGRWMSPDWSAKEEPVPYAKLDDPQSLNLYGYVGNNPLARADADGHCFWDLCIAEGTLTVEAVVGAAAITTAYLATPNGQALIHSVSQLFSSSSSSSQLSAPAPAPAAAKAPAATLPDDANVVRGGSGESGGAKPGANSPEGIAAGTGTHPSGVTGFSAESAPGKSPAELAAGVPNKQVGCCTVGQVRAAGGDVVPTTGRSPNHATVTGLTPQAASKLLTPTVPKDQLK